VLKKAFGHLAGVVVRDVALANAEMIAPLIDGSDMTTAAVETTQGIPTLGVMGEKGRPPPSTLSSPPAHSCNTSTCN